MGREGKINITSLTWKINTRKHYACFIYTLQQSVLILQQNILKWKLNYGYDVLCKSVDNLL